MIAFSSNSKLSDQFQSFEVSREHDFRLQNSFLVENKKTSPDIQKVQRRIAEQSSQKPSFHFSNESSTLYTSTHQKAHDPDYLFQNFDQVMQIKFEEHQNNLTQSSIKEKGMNKFNTHSPPIKKRLTQAFQDIQKTNTKKEDQKLIKIQQCLKNGGQSERETQSNEKKTEDFDQQLQSVSAVFEKNSNQIHRQQYSVFQQKKVLIRPESKDSSRLVQCGTEHPTDQQLMQLLIISRQQHYNNNNNQNNHNNHNQNNNNNSNNTQTHNYPNNTQTVNSLIDPTYNEINTIRDSSNNRNIFSSNYSIETNNFANSNVNNNIPSTKKQNSLGFQMISAKNGKKDVSSSSNGNSIFYMNNPGVTNQYQYGNTSGNTYLNHNGKQISFVSSRLREKSQITTRARTQVQNHESPENPFGFSPPAMPASYVNVNSFSDQEMFLDKCKRSISNPSGVQFYRNRNCTGGTINNHMLSCQNPSVFSNNQIDAQSARNQSQGTQNKLQEELALRSSNLIINRRPMVQRGYLIPNNGDHQVKANSDKTNKIKSGNLLFPDSLNTGPSPIGAAQFENNFLSQNQIQHLKKQLFQTQANTQLVPQQEEEGCGNSRSQIIPDDIDDDNRCQTLGNHQIMSVASQDNLTIANKENIENQYKQYLEGLKFEQTSCSPQGTNKPGIQNQNQLTPSNITTTQMTWKSQFLQELEKKSKNQLRALKPNSQSQEKSAGNSQVGSSLSNNNNNQKPSSFVSTNVTGNQVNSTNNSINNQILNNINNNINNQNGNPIPNKMSSNINSIREQNGIAKIMSSLNGNINNNPNSRVSGSFSDREAFAPSFQNVQNIQHQSYGLILDSSNQQQFLNQNHPQAKGNIFSSISPNLLFPVHSTSGNHPISSSSNNTSKLVNNNANNGGRLRSANVSIQHGDNQENIQPIVAFRESEQGMDNLRQRVETIQEYGKTNRGDFIKKIYGKVQANEVSEAEVSPYNLGSRDHSNFNSIINDGNNKSDGSDQPQVRQLVPSQQNQRQFTLEEQTMLSNNMQVALGIHLNGNKIENNNNKQNIKHIL